MESLFSALKAVVPSAGALALGVFLRQSVCNETDGETAAKFALWITLPALFLHNFNRAKIVDIVGNYGLLVPVAGYLALVFVMSVIAWFRARGLHPRERGLHVGISVGSAVSLFSIPLAGALFGVIGQQIALLCAFLDTLAVHALSYALFSTAGAAFPESFEHTDGGTYRGEWKGMLKEGHGVYKYTSGARYEGEWREGIKEGRGVYHFPKGGLYEGEWRAGMMSGFGVRTFASGKVQSGIWKEGKLDISLEEWQCALAVEGANESAAVARGITVGGATAGSIIRRAVSQPILWAFLLMFWTSMTSKALTPTVEAVAQRVSVAHGPLSMMAVGLAVDVAPPQRKQFRDISSIVGARLLPALLVLLVWACWAVWSNQPAGSTLIALGPLAVCLLAPISPTALEYAHMFRLNENLAASAIRVSTLASIVLAPIIGVTIATAAEQISPSLGPVIAVLAVALGCVTVGMLVASRLSTAGGQKQNEVRMVYTGRTNDGAAAAQKEVQALPQSGVDLTPPSATDAGGMAPGESGGAQPPHQRPAATAHRYNRVRQLRTGGVLLMPRVRQFARGLRNPSHYL